jgi:phosphopantothenoylcysteine synthetase/decarboxylase
MPSFARLKDVRDVDTPNGIERAMTPRRFLVTAGNTREMIDRVRDWGNIFTGNTGYSIAKALTPLGQVDLLTSNKTHIAQASTDAIRASAFSSHAELKGALAALLAREKYDAIFMTAAVADYKPIGVYSILQRTPGEASTEIWQVKNVQAAKVKSTHTQIAIVGAQTEKLVDLFRTAWNHKGLLFKFKLEVGVTPDELLRIGEASRKASDADYLIANTLEMVEGEGAGAYLLSTTGHEFIPRAALANKLAKVAADALNRD